MFSRLLESLSSLTSRMLPSRKPTKAFLTRPLSTTQTCITVASLPTLTDRDQIQIATDSPPTVGNLKESLRQVISILQSLSILWMKEGAVYLKAKTLMLKQKRAECMQRISLVISKSKESMLRITWTK